MRAQWVIVFIAVLVCLLASVAQATDINGTSLEELREADLPDPSTVKLAILPIQDLKGLERHVQIATGAVALFMTRCGFELVPDYKRPSRDSFTDSDATELAKILLQARDVFEEEEDVEPDEMLRRSEARRIGEKLGADWVMYGQVVEMHAYFGAGRKKAAVSVKLRIIDLATGDYVLSRQGFDRGSGGGVAGLWSRKSTALERTICVRGINETLADLCAALPRHAHQPPDLPTEEQALAVERAWNDLDPRRADR